MTAENPCPRSMPPDRAALSRPGRRRVRRGEAAFSLIEVLIVVTVIGILASVAVPQFLIARRLAAERAVIATLRTMVAEQQLFFLNPTPLPPSNLKETGRRYARLHELNAAVENRLGTMNGRNYLEGPAVRYSMVPLWPTTPALQGGFKIQATQRDMKKGFIYEIDESGRIVKIR